MALDISEAVETDLRVVHVFDFTGSEPGDQIGHGTFITSVIGSTNDECPGLAPDAELYVFKLFTGVHESSHQGFIDAFNKVEELGIDIINLSNGGNDFMDQPFIEKINELTAKGIIVISAIGNEGPF